MEPLIQAIQTDPLINGYTANEVSFKTSAYADDLTVFISSGSDALRVEYWMDTFSKASGATFNQNKSEAIFHLFSAPVTRFTVLDSLATFRYLGVPCSFKLNLKDAWSPLITKFKNKILDWSKPHINLSLSGKVTALKSYALPLLTYQASFLPIPPEHLEEIKKISRNFLWSGKKSKVSKDTLSLPKDEGGLNFPDIGSIFNSLKARWVVRLLDPSNHEWKSLAAWAIGNINADYGHGLSCLYCPGSSHDSNKALSPFWSEATLAFWKLKPTLSLTGEDPGTFARCMPLFNNPVIQLNGRPLKGNRWKSLARKGICRMADIIFNNRLGSLDDLSKFYGKIP